MRSRRSRRIGQRSGDAGRAPGRASHRDTAAQEPPVGAVLVADPVLVLKVIRLAGEMRLERLLERTDVVSMDAVHPFFGDDRCRRARTAPIIAFHRPEK